MSLLCKINYCNIFDSASWNIEHSWKKIPTFYYYISFYYISLWKSRYRRKPKNFYTNQNFMLRKLGIVNNFCFVFTVDFNYLPPCIQRKRDEKTDNGGNEREEEKKANEIWSPIKVESWKKMSSCRDWRKSRADRYWKIMNKRKWGSERIIILYIYIYIYIYIFCIVKSLSLFGE